MAILSILKFAVGFTIERFIRENAKIELEIKTLKSQLSPNKSQFLKTDLNAGDLLIREKIKAKETTKSQNNKEITELTSAYEIFTKN